MLICAPGISDVHVNQPLEAYICISMSIFYFCVVANSIDFLPHTLLYKMYLQRNVHGNDLHPGSLGFLFHSRLHLLFQCSMF